MQNMASSYDSGSTDYKTNTDRAALERSRYLVATTDLNEREARALAYREMGYSHSGVAQEMGVTQGTVATYMDRIAAQYGLKAVETKLPDERGNLEEMTPHRLMKLSASIQEGYAEIAAKCSSHVPVDVLDDLGER